MNNNISVINKFKNIAEVCNELFLTNYEGPPSMGWFKPNTFDGTPLENYKVWFPKFDKNETGWKNKFDNNGEEIISRNDTEKGKAEKGQKNITFANTGGEYTYAGIFELVKKDPDETEHWKKTSDKCVIFARLK